MARLARRDRKLGVAARSLAGRSERLMVGARCAAATLSPVFRLTVAGLLILPRTRTLGVRAGASAMIAASAARMIRDRLGRQRPGDRLEGGFPSRHAAAAAAIVSVGYAARRDWGVILGGVATLGLAGRVLSADHEPADIAAGAAIGVAIGTLAARIRTDR